MSELRPYQEQVLTAIRQSIASGVRRLVVQSPTGSGKTLVAARIGEGAQRKGNRLVFVVPAISLIDQTVEMFYAEGVRDIGVIQAEHPMTDWSKPIQVASIQTIRSRGAYPSAAVVIFDECFAKGTKVLTPHGEVAIEQIRLGDYVVNATGQGRVLAMRQRAAQTLAVKLSNGQTIRVTPEHPFFTANGWTSARNLVAGSHLFSQQAMSELWTGISPSYCDDCGAVAETNRMGETKVLLDLLLQETLQSDARFSHSQEAIRHVEAHWAQAESKRRKRERFVGCTAQDAGLIRERLATGTGGVDWVAPWHWRISEQLQARFGEQGWQDWYRDRWAEPQSWGTAAARPQERCFLGDIRVESIAIEERARIEPVFNLHISGHPSYFAGGVLVHNCHQLHKEHMRWCGKLDEDGIPACLPAWLNVPFIGLSATPWTKGLGRYFESLLCMSTTAALIEDGYLSPFRVMAADHPDLSEVKTVAGDYHEGQLSAVMQEQKLVANIVETWRKQWDKDKTFLFAVDCAHAKALQRRFWDAGISCAYQDAHTPLAERSEIKRGFHNGQYRVIANVGTLTTGVDYDVRCISFARPTKSEILFVQIIGRGLRIAEGKEHCLILDHTDTSSRLGFVTDIHHEELDDGKSRSRGTSERSAPLPKPCRECQYLIPVGAKACPNCGAERKVESTISERNGELVEFTGRYRRSEYTQQRSFPYSESEKRRFFAQLKGYGLESSYKPGWAKLKYLEKFGDWPPWHWNEHVTPMQAGPEVRAFIRSSVKEWLRSKRQAEKNPSPEAGGGADLEGKAAG